MNQNTDIASTGRKEYITFRIGEQEFCVDITATREIRGWSHATSLPYSPDYIIGVINLRGSILPIMDLSARLGMGRSEPSERHVIIVANVSERFIGLLVDSVSDILNAGSDDLQALPSGGSPDEEEVFRRVVVIENRLISEIALEAIMPELESVAA
ncbi:chemotaxis protein CheW [Oricola sp.]|uniref:chemotaxis protein CheW n=1 Tax=Oricola sp. TaxID=1979950 RepID=UPI003BAADDE7